MISFQADAPESYHAKQWLHFQASGQGPYFGQAVWFKIHHQEQLQSAVDRYINEIRRVLSVLNGVLQGREYLVDAKCSYADLVFVSWFEVVPWAAGDRVDLEKEFPNVHAWLSRLSHGLRSSLGWVGSLSRPRSCDRLFLHMQASSSWRE